MLNSTNLWRHQFPTSFCSLQYASFLPLFFLRANSLSLNNEMSYSISLPTCCFVIYLFDFSNCSGCMVVSHFGLICVFWWLVILSIFFCCACWLLMYLLNSQAARLTADCVSLGSGARACQLVGFILGQLGTTSLFHWGLTPSVDVHLFFWGFSVFKVSLTSVWERMS